MSEAHDQETTSPNDAAQTPAADPAPVDTGAPAAEGGWALPKEHASAAWAEGISSEADLFKKLGELHEKANREVNPEEYLAKLKPAEASEYEIPDYFEGEKVGQIQAMLHEAGLTKEQSSKLMARFIEFDKEEQTGMFGEDGFKEELSKSFGKDAEAPKAVAAALAKGLSADDQKLLENMPNPVVGLVYRAAHALIKDYGIQEGGPTATKPASPLTPEARRAEATRLWSQHDEFTSKGDFAQAAEIRQKINSLYGTK